MTTQTTNNEQAYRAAYDNGQPIIPDYVYDNVFGTTETTLDEERPGTLMKHLHPMLSLPTYFVNMDTLTEAELLNYGVNLNNEVDLSFKLDGVPCSAIYENGQWQRALSRGKRFEGYVLNPKFLSILPKLKVQTDETIDFRGEFVISKEDFETLNNALPESERYANPRSMVSAQINSTEPDDNILSKMHWFAHGIWIGDKSFHHFLELRKYLEGKYIAPHICCCRNSGIIVEDITKFYDMAMQFAYPCDGIVLQHSITTNNDGRCNLDRIALKQFDEAKFSAESELEKIEWRLANNGSYFPRLWFKPVAINGSTVNHTAGYCWDYVRRLGLSIGAKVILTMRGGVIPYVSRVIIPGNQDYQLPADIAEIEEGDMHIWSTNSEDAIQRLRFIRGMEMLDLTDCGKESFSKLYDSGYKTLFDLKGLTVEALLAKGWSNTPTTFMLVQTILDRINTFNYVWCILALRFPGIGFKAANIIGQTMSGYTLKPGNKFNKAMNAFMATDLPEKVKAFANQVLPEHADLAIIDRPVETNKKKVCMSKKPTNGMKKADFFATYLANDYIETGNIREADLLVCPEGEHSSKIDYALAHGIEIKSYNDVINESK